LSVLQNANSSVCEKLQDTAGRNTRPKGPRFNSQPVHYL